MRIAVYGTLREGESRAGAFKEFGKITSRKIKTLRGFKMFDLGDYPAAFETGDENDEIVVELLDFKGNEKELLKLLDQLEGVQYGYYKRKYIKIDGKKVLIYVMNDVYFDRVSRLYPVIKDWKVREAVANT